MKLKEMTVLNQHAVVELHRRDEIQKLFLRPGSYLEAHCAPYIDQGWTLYSFQLCTREEYLNFRVDDLMESLDDSSEELKRLHNQFKAREISFETYMTSRGVVQELTELDLRRLYRAINRLRWDDLNVYNEEAMRLYNRVF